MRVVTNSLNTPFLQQYSLFTTQKSSSLKSINHHPQAYRPARGLKEPSLCRDGTQTLCQDNHSLQPAHSNTGNTLLSDASFFFSLTLFFPQSNSFVSGPPREYTIRYPKNPANNSPAQASKEVTVVPLFRGGGPLTYHRIMLPVLAWTRCPLPRSMHGARLRVQLSLSLLDAGV